MARSTSLISVPTELQESVRKFEYRLDQFEEAVRHHHTRGSMEQEHREETIIEYAEQKLAIRNWFRTYVNTSSGVKDA